MHEIYLVKYKIGNNYYHKFHLSVVDFGKTKNIQLINRNVAYDWRKIDPSWKNMVKIDNRFHFIKRVVFLNKKDKLIVVDSNDVDKAKSYKYIQFFERRIKLKLKRIDHENNRHI